MTDIPSIYYRRKFIILMTLRLKALMSKFENCDFKRAVRVIDNRDKFDNNRCRD